MFEFKWQLPGTHDRQVVLWIHSRRGWFGRKVLTMDGRSIFRRGPLGGIYASFQEPAAGRRLELLTVPTAKGDGWRPALYRDGLELPERTGTVPPAAPRRPKSVAVATGLTCLTMLIVAVMFPHIWNMLDSAMGHSDERMLMLEVAGDSTDAGPRVLTGGLPDAIAGQPFEAALVLDGGSPPVSWERRKGRMPDGLSFDGSSGVICGMPEKPGDALIRLRVTDSAGVTKEKPCVIRVSPAEAPEPRITTRALPPAVVGVPYSTVLEAAGGDPSPGSRGPRYQWVVNDRKLPKGLTFDVTTGELKGTPNARSAGAYPIWFRVSDRTYSPMQHLAPWFAPLGVSAVCLLGYWNMQRWSVWLYGALIAAQLAAGLMIPAYPLSWTAIVLQGLVWSTGAACVGKMR